MADPSRHEPDGSLSRILAAQVDAVQRLHELLQEEFRVLSGGDVSSLTTLAQDKAAAAETLAGLAAEGEAGLQARGLPSGHAGWSLWIAASPPAHRVRLEGLWGSLLEGLEAVATQNQVNGRALELRRQGTEQLLDALRGQSRDTYGPLRGATGQTLAEV